MSINPIQAPVIVVTPPARRPIIDPILSLFRSRRFLIALASIIATLIIYAIPDLAESRDIIVGIISTFALVLIGGYSFEDAKRIGTTVATEPQESPFDFFDDLLTELKDGVLEALEDEIEARADARAVVKAQELLGTGETPRQS